jgi:molybdenum-dependent DNA-binding transcriptional regulator ModE
MVIKVEYVQNAPRSGRPSISLLIIIYVLKVITQNSTTYGFSYKTIRQEIERQGF